MPSKKGARNIGVAATPPSEECDDPKCPWHGTLSIRGKIIEGIVVSSKTPRTVIVERHYLHYLPKYERYERRHSRIAAHNPPCIDAKEGERVRIGECRPLSKTKHFVVIEKVKR